MPVGPGDRAAVADLTAALGIERCPVEEQLEELRRLRPAGNDGQNAGFRGVVRVADELGDAELLDQLPVGVEVGVVGAGLRRAALARCRCSAISVSKPATSTVDIALAGDLLGQLEREPVRVVEEERGRIPTAAVAPSIRSSCSRMRQAVAQRLAEALLLLAEHADDEVTLAGDVRVGGAHHVDRDLGEAAA